MKHHAGWGTPTRDPETLRARPKTVLPFVLDDTEWSWNPTGFTKRGGFAPDGSGPC